MCVSFTHLDVSQLHRLGQFIGWFMTAELLNRFTLTQLQGAVKCLDAVHCYTVQKVFSGYVRRFLMLCDLATLKDTHYCLQNEIKMSSTKPPPLELFPFFNFGSEISFAYNYYYCA